MARRCDWDKLRRRSGSFKFIKQSRATGRQKHFILELLLSSGNVMAKQHPLAIQNWLQSLSLSDASDLIERLKKRR